MMTTANRLPPGRAGLPVIGETPSFLSNPTQFVVERYAKYGPIFRSHIFGAPTVFLVGPEALHFVLSSHRDHFSSSEGWPEGLKMLTGDSWLRKDDEEHARNRRTSVPVFHGKALAGYAATMEATILRYLERWESQREFAWYPDLRQMAFEIASQILLGIAPSEKEAQDINQLFITCAKGMEGLHPLFPTRLLWTTFGRALAAHIKLIQYIKQIIRKCMQTPAHDGISLMIQAYNMDGKGIDIEELAEYVLFFLWAGHESVTSFSASFCLEMALHPDILQLAQEEQRVLEGSNLALLEKVKKMEYLDQIVLEVERLHPPFTGSLRGVVKPFDFQGFSVPAGWRLIWSIAGTHRIDTLYPDSERFDPARFHAAPVSQMRHNFQLVGFGGGIHSCLGRDFARLEVKLLASHLLRKYRWHLLSEQRLEPVSTPIATWPPRHPRDGLRVSFQRL